MRQMKRNYSDSIAETRIDSDTILVVQKNQDNNISEIPPITSPSATSKSETIDPSSLKAKYINVVNALEAIERNLRLIYHPSLAERADPLEVDDLKDIERQQDPNLQPYFKKQLDYQPGEAVESNAESIKAIISEEGTTASLRKRGLKEIFKITDSILPLPIPSLTFESLLTLDVSNYELTDLPGLSTLKNLRVIDLHRNWFNTLPSEIGALGHLEKLLVARNFLKPNHQSLRLEILKASCPKLNILDLRYNQKCCRPLHRDRIQEALLPLKPTITMTLWEEEVHGNNNTASKNNNYVGSSAAQRDPILLRSQLEPLGTVALRKRLVCDFGKEPTDPAKVDRSGVMRDLLRAYFEEGLAYFPESIDEKSHDNGKDSNEKDIDSNPNVNYDSLVADRKALQLYGSPVPENKLESLMIELEKWTAHTGLINKNRERPSIHASNYMILRKPPPASEAHIDTSGRPLSRRALRKIQKRERYRSLWEAGIDALNCVDPVFAEKNCTEIAITYGFSGSPHRDKQNCGPFYGLSLGNYDDSDGKGGIVVEASARVVVRVNTKNRLGRVDGRYVHWVAPWKTNASTETEGEQQQQQQRYSLIYYETGHDYVTPGPAVFSVPEDVSAEEA